MLEAPKSDGTVGKALQVLDQVAEFRRPVRFSELLENSPFPKPTLYRFVQTLTNQGMLSFDPDRQTYAMGVRLVRLAHSAWRYSSLARVARPYIEALAAKVGEAVHLAQLDNGHVLFVDKCKATDHFETLAQAGKIAPGYCTGVGKAILAFMPEVEQNRALDQQSYTAYTPFTLTNRAALMTEITQIKEDGFAYDREEHEQGIISIACPILNGQGRVVGAVSIATSTNRYTIKNLEKQRPNLMRSANLIGAEAELWQVPIWN
jgi:IclR family KDG regulon transcriptional repressor